MKFELLVLDAKEASVVQDSSQLAYALAAHGDIKLASSNPVDSGRLNLHQGGEIRISPVESDKDLQPPLNRAFKVSLTGDIREIEPIRYLIVAHLRKLSFDYIYVLKDEVSQEIACSLYPLLYQVENSLRNYLISFMVTRLGPRWWEATAGSELSQKATQRKNNEPIFGEYADNKAYLIDFGDLGRLIYAQSAGFTSKDDIISKVMDLEESVEALRSFKKELQSNYQKFFKETFRSRDFQAKWEAFEKLRNKIAHSNLFVAADQDLGQQLARELLEIIADAEALLPQVSIAPEEKQALRDSYSESNRLYKPIEENVFLEHLADAEGSYCDRPGGYVGLARFVKYDLGQLGYDYASSYEIADLLHAAGKVEIYKVQNPHDAEEQASAIRIKEARQ